MTFIANIINYSTSSFGSFEVSGFHLILTSVFFLIFISVLISCSGVTKFCIFHCEITVQIKRQDLRMFWLAFISETSNTIEAPYSSPSLSCLKFFYCNFLTEKCNEIQRNSLRVSYMEIYSSKNRRSIF